MDDDEDDGRVMILGDDDGDDVHDRGDEHEDGTGVVVRNTV